MKRSALNAVLVGLPLALLVALGGCGSKSHKASSTPKAPAAQAQAPRAVITCSLTVTKAAQIPASPSAAASGRCVVLSATPDGGRGTSQFTLIGNPPNMVRGSTTFVGKMGTISGSFQGPTAPVTFKPGTPPQVGIAVAIAQLSVVKATGAYASLKGGVSAAYQNNATKALKVSILLS